MLDFNDLFGVKQSTDVTDECERRGHSKIGLNIKNPDPECKSCPHFNSCMNLALASEKLVVGYKIEGNEICV